MKISAITFIIVAFLIATPVCSLNLNNPVISEKYDTSQGTEYWALLVGVGVYYNHPEQNRPSMLESVDNLYQVLSAAPNWESDHIHRLKGSQATVQNLFKELLWLINSEGDGDMSLIYITTHGTSLKYNGQPLDIPPKDESDGSDESLAMYYGFDRWYSFITDDILNFFLSLLESKGVCVIIDSCHSGGFNDQPFFKPRNINNEKSYEFDSTTFKKGFVEDIGARDRIVLMSTEEDLLSYGNVFISSIISGLDLNIADIYYGNHDGINSAEESFRLADDWVNDIMGNKQDPTILDLYPGEFPLAYS
jgi:hypothetical protein